MKHYFCLLQKGKSKKLPRHLIHFVKHRLCAISLPFIHGPLGKQLYKVNNSVTNFWLEAVRFYTHALPGKSQSSTVTVHSLVTGFKSSPGWVTINAVATCAIPFNIPNKNTSFYPATSQYEKLPIPYQGTDFFQAWSIISNRKIALRFHWTKRRYHVAKFECLNFLIPTWSSTQDFVLPKAASKPAGAPPAPRSSALLTPLAAQHLPCHGSPPPPSPADWPSSEKGKRLPAATAAQPLGMGKVNMAKQQQVRWTGGITETSTCRGMTRSARAGHRMKPGAGGGTGGEAAAAQAGWPGAAGQHPTPGAEGCERCRRGPFQAPPQLSRKQFLIYDLH